VFITKNATNLDWPSQSLAAIVGKGAEEGISLRYRDAGDDEALDEAGEQESFGGVGTVEVLLWAPAAASFETISAGEPAIRGYKASYSRLAQLIVSSATMRIESDSGGETADPMLIASYFGFCAIIRIRAPRPNKWNSRSSAVKNARASGAFRLNCSMSKRGAFESTSLLRME
jgi:hypothetical protein